MKGRAYVCVFAFDGIPSLKENSKDRTSATMIRTTVQRIAFPTRSNLPCLRLFRMVSTYDKRVGLHPLARGGRIPVRNEITVREFSSSRKKKSPSPSAKQPRDDSTDTNAIDFERLEGTMEDRVQRFQEHLNLMRSHGLSPGTTVDPFTTAWFPCLELLERMHVTAKDGSSAPLKHLAHVTTKDALTLLVHVHHPPVRQHVELETS